MQEISYRDSVDVTITNWNEENSIEVLLIVAQNSESAMVKGEIDWQELSTMSEVTTIAPSDTITLTVNQPKVWTLVVMHHPGEENSGITEISVSNDYHHKESLVSAYLLSIPSLWITGNVVYRLFRVKKSGLSWYTSLPSHAWSNDESE